MDINKERLWNNMMELSKIGRNEDGGITRLSFTPEEKKAKEFVSSLMTEAGLNVYEDEIGNLIGRKDGKNPSEAAIIVGSHIDSVLSGGFFDGPAGVLTAIEALHTMKDREIETDSPIEVIAFTDEEGARFSSGMLGSQAIAGQLSQQELHRLKDNDGISVADAMKKMGYHPELVEKAERNPSTVKAYLELHIEQGKELENESLPAGIVTGIVGVKWLSVKLRGEAGHAGTTPMNLRKDPLAAAAKIISYAEEIAAAEEGTVATVGRIHASPGGVNIIPGEVEFSLDVRDLSEDNLNKIIGMIKDYTHETSLQRNIDYQIEELHTLKPAKSSPILMDAVKESVEELGIRPYMLASGAGHDAMVMASIAEMCMIFIRSKDGISHNPKEWSDKEDVAVGADILFRTLLKVDKKRII
ncbi:Zn-dependent hydrolase [Pseudalkalibacillus caeni]|uniref:Zn-dependent hydrolase n=1 Tax=Exobacillus caeni TaxID=2574798 RepID=A0A5R9F2Y6_9BACL|nr:Zn-dependent hydrolase [Pseudalkalibacillus caeni]TLS36850.1 Zn-dependent hydrolase [Pseudalkalibacillus caeni]